jgi:hypothetical protein
MFGSGAVVMIIGLVIGYLLGFSGLAIADGGFGPGRFWSLVAFGLGAGAALLVQRFVRSAPVDEPGEESKRHRSAACLN